MRSVRKKIIGIFICILLIATAAPAVESLKNSATHTTVPITTLKDMAASWTEMHKFLPSNTVGEDVFGCSVSLDGDTALIGAMYDHENGYDAGAAYVFTRTGTTWTQQAKLIASDGGEKDDFGSSVSLSGDTALIGSIWDDDRGVNSGSAYVFTRTGTTWTQQAKLLASDGAPYDYFGCSVSLSGDTALIGTFVGEIDHMGSAYVFTRTGTTWTQQQKLLASDEAELDQFGCSVALNGDTALIGAYHDNDNGNESGSAYVFTRTGTTWTQQAKLLASDGAAFDFFGWSVALSGDTALIGAKWDNDNGEQSGSAYVFTRTGTSWTQQAKLLASDGEMYDDFGYSVSLSGDTALIGVDGDDDNGNESGSAYVFTRTGTAWTQQAKLLASDGTSWELFGGSVALDNDTALIGAIGYEKYKGSTYVFIRTEVTWTEQNKLFISCGTDDEGAWTQLQVTMSKGKTYIPSLFLELIERLMERFPLCIPDTETPFGLLNPNLFFFFSFERLSNNSTFAGFF